MRFVKMQATGNDFIVVEPPVAGLDWAREAMRLCDRHFGIGADGVILPLPTQAADIRMQIFLKDGSELEMCGNGIRCLTKFVLDRGLVRAPDGPLTVEAKAGLRTVWPARGPEGEVISVRVDMRAPEFDPSRIPMAVPRPGPILDHEVHAGGRSLRAGFLSMGNPHAVVMLDTPVEDFPLGEIGPLVEQHALFPKRVNFEIFNVLDRNRIRTRVWERGAGMTMACGTGACATFVVAHLKGLVDDWAIVEAPGGTLRIEWDGTASVYLTGPVERVYRGELID